jgi:hypothetical protein
MTLLRRALQIQAALWFGGGLAFGLLPTWVAESLMSQEPIGEYAWARAGAIMGVVLALLMVLVSRTLDQVWWWSWAFVLLSAGMATLCAVNAAFGLGPASAAWPWWVLAGIHAALGALLLLGLSAAGREQPIIDDD